MHAHMLHDTAKDVEIRSQEDNFQEVVFSFCRVGLGNGTQVAGLGGKCLKPLSHLTNLVPYIIP